MNNKCIYKKVAEELNIPVEVVERVHTHYYRFIRSIIKGMNINEDLDRYSFNLPKLGKLYLNKKKIKKINKK